MFVLHPRLAADTVPVATWPLCEVRLMNDSTYPWLILVPQRAEMSEIHQLSPEDRNRVIQEIALAGRLLESATNADKINVAALGNMVPQLHIHVIARFEKDPAWPHPVWGRFPSQPYDETTLSHTLRMLRDAMTPPRPPVV